MSDGRAYSVFLSYSRSDADRRHVSALWNIIENANFRTFYDRSDLVTGDGTMGPQIAAALAEARLMLVCVGRQGLGPYQRKEVAHALGLGQGVDGRGPNVRILMLGDVSYAELPSLGGLQPGDGDDERMRTFLAALADSSLESAAELAYSFPPRDGAPTTGDILRWLAEHASSRQIEEKPNPEADAEATELADQFGSTGITVVVGSVWPDRAQEGVFSASRYARRLLQRCSISETASLSLEQAATLYGLFADNDSERTRRRLGMKSEIKDSVALRSPYIYGRICEVIDGLKQQFDDGRRERKPIVLLTTNVDALLERELVDKGVSFISLTPGAEDTYRQTHFWVGGDTDRRGNALLSLDSHPTEGRRDGQGVPAGYPKKFPPERFEVSMEVYDRERDLLAVPTGARKTSVERFESYRQKLENVYADRRIWRISEIDRMVQEHYNYATLDVTYDAVRKTNKDKTQTNAESVHDICLRDGIPIVVKMLGCVHDPSEGVGIDVEAMLQMFQNAEERFPPSQIRAKVGSTGVLFCGFSFADFGYFYAFSRMFGNKLKNSARTKRIFLTATDTGNGTKLDHFDEVDSAIATRTHTQLDMLRNVTVVARPGVRRFVETLARQLAPAD